MPRLNLTQRFVLGLLFEEYPNYIRRKDLSEKLSTMADAKRELAYLVEKGFVDKFGVPPKSMRRRVIEDLIGAAADPQMYSDRAYRITVQGIDAFREPFAEPGAKAGKPKALPAQKTECGHEKATPIEIKKSLSVASADKGSPRYVAIYYCPKCRETFWKSVKQLPGSTELK